MPKLLKKRIILICWSVLTQHQNIILAKNSTVVSLPEVTIDVQTKDSHNEENTITELNSENIELGVTNHKSVSQELTRSASVQAVPNSTGSAPPSFSLRGMDPSQTRIFVEGIPLTEPVFLSDNLLGLPKLSTHRAELFVGAVPAAFLTSSLGGAINIELRDGRPGNTFLAQTGNLGVIKVGGQSRLNSGLNLNLEYEQADENFSYQDDNGTPFNAADDQLKERSFNRFKRISFLPFFRKENSGKNQFDAFSITSLQLAEVPGPTFRPSPHQLKEGNSLNAIRSRFFLTENVTGEGLLFFRIRGDELSNELAFESRAKLGKNYTVNYTGGSKATLEWKTGDWDGLAALGVNYTKYDFDGEIQKQNQFSVDSFEIPASVTAKMMVSRFVELKPSYLISISDSQVSTSPRLGFEATLSEQITLFGLGGVFYRRPSLSERYGNNFSLSQNTSLKTETAVKGELGLIWYPHLFDGVTKTSFSFVVFGARAKELITLSQIGAGLQRAENIGKASWVGQELSGRFESRWGTYFRPSILLLQTRNESEIVAETGKLLPFRYPSTVRAEIGIARESWSGGHRISVFSESFFDRANQKRLAPYQIHDLFLGLKVRELGAFELNVQNLFNITLAKVSEAGVDSMQFISGVNGYPTVGRRVGITWVYDL